MLFFASLNVSHLAGFGWFSEWKKYSNKFQKFIGFHLMMVCSVRRSTTLPFYCICVCAYIMHVHHQHTPLCVFSMASQMFPLVLIKMSMATKKVRNKRETVSQRQNVERERESKYFPMFMRLRVGFYSVFALNGVRCQKFITDCKGINDPCIAHHVLSRCNTNVIRDPTYSPRMHIQYVLIHSSKFSPIVSIYVD